MSTVAESSPKSPPKKTPTPRPAAASKETAKPAPAAPKGEGTQPTAPKTTPPKGGAAPAKAAPAGTAGGAKEEPVTVVDEPTPKKHTARAKPQLAAPLVSRLRLRRELAGRRPTFRRQQWYEYKRLADSGWRKPTGVDSAMRRHFGYEQSVVRVGFRGPAEVRGLHASGFQEVRVETLRDLEAIDPKRQAARLSATLGARRLKVLYAEADKRGVRVLNRRRLE